VDANEEKPRIQVLRGQMVVQLAQPADMLESRDAHFAVAI
jgi:hypothetical protein